MDHIEEFYEDDELKRDELAEKIPKGINVNWWNKLVISFCNL